MYGLMDKAKDAMGKASGNKETTDKIDSYANKGIDQATDKAGMGDKYDSKIDSTADKQLNEQMKKQGSS